MFYTNFKRSKSLERSSSFTSYHFKPKHKRTIVNATVVSSIPLLGNEIFNIFSLLALITRQSRR